MLAVVVILDLFRWRVPGPVKAGTPRFKWEIGHGRQSMGSEIDREIRQAPDADQCNGADEHRATDDTSQHVACGSTVVMKQNE
jgi:hypothetical protein